MTTMLDSLSAAMDWAGMTAHRDAARPSDSCGVTQNDPSRGASTFQADESVSTASNLTQSDGVECGICHELRTPDTWCMDMEVGEYAVCTECNRPQPAPRRIVQDRAEQDLDVRPDSQAAASNPRRMVAVTVALSEPADGSPLDWSETVASVLRLAFANTSVHVIDTWRNDA